MRTVGLVLVIMAIALMVAFPIIIYFGVSMNAEIAYQNAFGGDVIMAYDAADFQGIKQQIVTIWTNMNNTWPTNHRQIYNSWWPWDKTMSNTLYAQDLYFSRLINRLNGYDIQWQTIQAGKVIVQGDWYQTTLTGLREDMKSEGGLDWAIRGAYYLEFYPIAYFSFLYNIIVWAVGTIIAIVGRVLPDPRRSNY